MLLGDRERSPNLASLLVSNDCYTKAITVREWGIHDC
jgi:hypothetical protein